MGTGQVEAGRLVFTFPGQGSFRHAVLCELHDSFQFEAEFIQADEIGKRILGHDFLPLIRARTLQECNQVLEICPDLDQIAIYLTDFLIAKILLDSRVQPDALLGHSFGELAALAIAGVYSFETGLRIVCQRSAALRPLSSVGQMAAASCSAQRTAELIASLGETSLSVAVINHARQTVISGTPPELEKLGECMAREGIGLSVLKARYPFHSPLLRPAVGPLQLMLRSYEFQAARIPVYLGTEQKFYSPECDLAATLSHQLITRLDFAGMMRSLYDAGYRKFIECGAGNIVTKITMESGLQGLAARATVGVDGVKAGCSPIVKEYAAGAASEGGIATLPISELHDLLRQMQGLINRTSRVLERLTPRPAAGREPPVEVEEELAPESQPDPPQPATTAPPAGSAAEVERCETVPIAIVASGCVLPGARHPEEYWNNIQEGVSGIVDLAQHDKSMARDFLARPDGDEVRIVPDKTYTLLHGSVGAISDDEGNVVSAAYSKPEFACLTRAEKLLALATAQAVSGMKSGLCPGKERAQCVLGATADGCGEYDNALFLQSLGPMLESIEPDSGVRAGFLAALRKVWGEPPENGVRAAEQPSYDSLIRKVTGCDIGTYVIDAACSSSLYAIAMGMKVLEDRSADVVLAGGVFAPGPANNTLFAQFRGLTPVASRPFDESADGVVFGDGAGIVILKRLPDAMAAGDRVLSVIRAVGVSSDGKSPAINVPQAKGQALAIRRAYEASHIDVNTIQYVEAHATATPVGDAVEFHALREAMVRDSSLPPIELGSVKALIGHTGWAAGVASVIKICKAFEKAIIPPQYNYRSPSPEFALQESQFAISTVSHPWPANVAGLPRRAAINGFGFGGTNAHMILEQYDPDYHRRLCAGMVVAPPKPGVLAVLAATSLFPSARQLWDAAPSSQREFQRSLLRLPNGKRLLPDVQDHMDPAQYLTLLAAEDLLARLGQQSAGFREATAVVVGVDSKTERSIFANQRIFLDRLKRMSAENGHNDLLSGETRNGLLNKLCDAIRKHVIPSGPYTLSGLMPNVISGRVANVFDLNGPNVVVDMGASSLFQSILIARDFLMHNDCKVVLAGGVNALRLSPEDREAVFLMALTTEETAREQNLPISCLLTVSNNNGGKPQSQEPGESAPHRGAEGILELSQAIAAVCEKKEEYSVSGKPSGRSHGVTLTFRPIQAAEHGSRPKPVPGSTYAYVQGTPILYYTPVQVASDLGKTSQSLAGGKILFVTDQPQHWRALEESGVLQPLDYQVLCPKSARLAASIEIDLATDESIRRTLAVRNSADTIIAVKFLGNSSGNSLLDPEAGNLELLDLLFSICRHAYEDIQNKKTAVATVCLGAFVDGRLSPFTGALSGFMKALARELPNSICRIVNLEQDDFSQVLRSLAAELGHNGECAEVSYRAGKRYEMRLAHQEQVARGSAPMLSQESVVLATGGGRGVTAVLAEELLDRFGCTVIAFGRTDPEAAPNAVLQMSADELAQYEQQFYRDELARDKTRKITQLKEQYRSYQAAHEVHQTLQRLVMRPGRFEYVKADLTDRETAARVLDSVFQKYGRADLVLHGAGTQISKVLTKKSIDDFRSVLGAKLASLRHIHAACERHRNGRPVHYHILTSAFSYIGNDGQTDYGAANEALGRIADTMNASATAGRWCSVAWLGWAGIGMTRGSEFAALAASRGLRGITREEGRGIFSRFLAGTPLAAINVLLAEGEIKFYKVAPAPDVAPAKALEPALDVLVTNHTVRLQDVPYVLNHLVNGIPTLPGAFLIMMVAKAALELRPRLKVTAFEDASFRKFVRLRGSEPTQLQLRSTVISENAEGALLRVEVISDFVHKSGVVLQKDVVQTEISVRMAAAIERPIKSVGVNIVQGRLLHDPYVTNGSPVRLNGPFRTMKNIIVGERNRSADYKPLQPIPQGSEYEAFLPNLLVMDSLWRFGAIRTNDHNALPVYVPEACRVMKVYYDLAAPDIPTLTGQLMLTGSNPQEDDDRLVIGPVAVRDAAGAILLAVEGGICRQMGEVRNGD